MDKKKKTEKKKIVSYDNERKIWSSKNCSYFSFLFGKCCFYTRTEYTDVICSRLQSVVIINFLFCIVNSQQKNKTIENNLIFDILHGPSSCQNHEKQTTQNTSWLLRPRE